ncbi:MAG: hypothetical protein AVDCRST_MAG90-1784, partial [uncultured Microvirga sp.]
GGPDRGSRSRACGRGPGVRGLPRRSASRHDRGGPDAERSHALRRDRFGRCRCCDRLARPTVPRL